MLRSFRVPNEKQGQTDYSGLLTTFVGKVQKRILSEQRSGQVWRRSGSPGPGALGKDRCGNRHVHLGAMGISLGNFRKRYPVDDRAFDFLEKSDEQVIRAVLRSFKVPSERQGQSDYSGLLTTFVGKVQRRILREQRRTSREAGIWSTRRQTAA